jgi:hypothetical protein
MTNLTSLILVVCGLADWSGGGTQQFLERKLNKFSKSTSQFKFSSRGVLINRNKSGRRERV